MSYLQFATSRAAELASTFHQRVELNRHHHAETDMMPSEHAEMMEVMAQEPDISSVEWRPVESDTQENIIISADKTELLRQEFNEINNTFDDLKQSTGSLPTVGALDEPASLPTEQAEPATSEPAQLVDEPTVESSVHDENNESSVHDEESNNQSLFMTVSLETVLESHGFVPGSLDNQFSLRSRLADTLGQPVSDEEILGRLLSSACEQSEIQIVQDGQWYINDAVHEKVHIGHISDECLWVFAKWFFIDAASTDYIRDLVRNWDEVVDEWKAGMNDARLNDWREVVQ